MRLETIAKGMTFTKDKSRYKAMAKMLSLNKNGMTQIAIKCEKDKLKNQEAREDPSNNKGKTEDLNLNGQNIVL